MLIISLLWLPGIVEPYLLYTFAAFVYIKIKQDIKEIWDPIYKTVFTAHILYPLTYIANYKYKYLIRKSYSFINNEQYLGWVDIKQQRF